MTAAHTTAARRWRTVLLASVTGLAAGAAVLQTSAAGAFPGAVQQLAGVTTQAAGGNGQGNNGNGQGNGGGSGGTAPPPKSFVVSGKIDDSSSPAQKLAPGVGRTLSLSVQNLNNQPITITKLTVTAAAASGSCPASLLLLGTEQTAGAGSRTVSIPVGAKNSSSGGIVSGISFPITLSPSVEDDCQGVTWKLTYGGTAVQS